MIKYILLSLILTFAISGGTAMATEEPVFKLVLQAEAFEVREYPALIAAEVSVGGDRSEAVNAGFRLLAGYIFGGNTRSQSIAMTAPVIQAPPAGEKIAMTAPVTQTGNADAWVIRFIMPSSYTLDTLPTPNDPKVQLKTLPPSRVAVVRFSGLAHEADIEQKTAELYDFIAANHLRAAGPPSLARYNPPWTLWFLRRNEIMIPLQEETAH
jgi:hypothetical protein